MDIEERPEDAARRFAKDLIQAQKDLAAANAHVERLAVQLRDLDFDCIAARDGAAQQRGRVERAEARIAEIAAVFGFPDDGQPHTELKPPAEYAMEVGAWTVAECSRYSAELNLAKDRIEALEAALRWALPYLRGITWMAREDVATRIQAEALLATSTENAAREPSAKEGART
jgi:hypothetical protein